jgi:hypothetical protein
MSFRTRWWCSSSGYRKSRPTWGLYHLHSVEVHQPWHKFSQVSGVHNFGDLTITSNAAGDAVITANHDTVTLVGVSGHTLTAHDFMIT